MKVQNKVIKFDMDEVKYQMWINLTLNKEQIDCFVSNIKKCGDLEEIAHKMCAINYLGWHYYQKGDDRAQMWFEACRNLQRWAYADDGKHNINLEDDAAANLYSVLD